MKATFFTLAFAIFSATTTLAQQNQFRCVCLNSSGTALNNISSLCTAKGGTLEPSRTNLCIKQSSRFSNADCDKLAKGAKAECIAEPPAGTTPVVAGRAESTPKPKLVRAAPWERV